MSAVFSECKRGWIFANGVVDNPKEIRSWIEAGDLLIAVDGGSRYLAGLGLSPDLLVGDLDSIAPALLDLYRRQGIQILRHPAEKDETDLELAVDTAIQRGCPVIRILGAMGGRLDHTLGNLSVLFDPRLEGADIRIVDARQEIFAVWKEAKISGKPGDLLSLIPFSGDAHGVWTEGLYYPLREETLYLHKTRGISNLFIGDQARVGLSEGRLLCIHIRV